MDFRILGPLEAVDETGPVRLTAGRRTALLAILLLRGDRVVPLERLVDDLWGEDVPETATKMVQIYVSQLRKQLPRGLIRTRSPGYLLHLEGHTLDLRTFERLHADGRQALASGRTDEAAVTLRRALDLWRGAPLAEFEEPFARPEGARLGELHLTCLEECIDAELALGRHAELVAELDALVRDHPFRERPRGQLMLALYRCGRHAEALEAFQTFRRMLQDELGIDPPPRLKELERMVLRQDPSLDAVPDERAVGRGATPSVDAVPTPAPPEEPRRAVVRREPALDAPAVAGQPSSPPSLVESRRTVTVLAADVSPADAPDDPEALRATVQERGRAAESELERHGASVTSLGGGRVLGVFGIPAAREDDALRAVRAAVALRRSSLAGRIGLATGEVVTGDPLASGPPIDEAARLLERAGRGDVLAAARTRRAVRHAVTASPQDGAWAIDAVDADAGPVLRRLETPLVGRERELREIVEGFERAAAERRPHLVTVFGAPGVGKTRLARECAERLRGAATVVVGRCDADTQDATYAPLRDVLTALAGGDAAAWVHERLGTGDGTHLAEQLTAAVGLAEGNAGTEDAALAARRLLAGLALERPLVLVFDDVHWAAPSFLDLVESIVELVRSPVLVLCLARPDLLGVRPHWGGGRLSSSAILLDALTATESEALLDRLAPGGGLGAGARDRILTVAEGNPLFIEQLLAAALEGDPETLPDSIQTVIEARLDRLDALDRAVAEAAAVCGVSFTTEDVGALVHADPTGPLVTLVRRELVRPGEDDDPDGAPGWSFRHALIRDVTYGSVPKRRRAELHERLATRAAEREADGDASAGFHLEHAVRARRETGERGTVVDELAARAAEHLRRAGMAAYDRADMAAASSLLRRAAELVPRRSTERVELLLRLGDALGWAGERDAAQRVLADAHAVATELGDVRGVLTARATLVAGLALVWGTASAEQILGEIDDAVPVLERAGDHEALAIAELGRFHAYDRGRLPDPEGRLSVALEHARKAGARHIEHNVLGWLCITLQRGVVPVDAAIARAEEILRGSSSALVHASAVGALGVLHAMKAELDEGRTLVEEARLALEELGLRHAEAAHSIAIGEVEVMAGDEATAEQVFTSGLEAMRSFGDEHTSANLAWRLGLLLARQGRDDEAEALARVAERFPSPGFWIDVWWRVVLALVEAHRGGDERARGLVAEACGLMATTQESGMHADALLECAEALRASGDANAAAALVDEAAGVAGRLGYVVASRRAEDARGAFGA